MIARTNKTALFTGIFTALLLFCRNALMYGLFSFAYYPDSNLYVQLGKTFFETGTISPLVMFPYPLMNALTRSYYNPVFLVWLQMFLAAAAGGFCGITILTCCAGIYRPPKIMVVWMFPGVKPFANHILNGQRAARSTRCTRKPLLRSCKYTLLLLGLFHVSVLKIIISLTQPPGWG